MWNVLFWFHLFSIFNYISNIHAINDEIKCDRPQPKKAELRGKLFCNIDVSERPVLDPKEPTNVTVHFNLKSMSYGLQEESLTINFWLTVYWTDKLLTWKQEDYSDIKQLIVKASSIWNPDLSIYNRLEEDGSASLMKTDNCILQNTGEVTCLTANNHKILCRPNLKYFPYDKQNCSMYIGSWLHLGHEINITAPHSISLSEFDQGGDWKLNQVKIEHVTEAYEVTSITYLKIEFLIERNSGLLFYTTIAPTFTMLIMTIVAFFMDIRTQERIIVICTNIFLHDFYTELLQWTLLNSGATPPILIVYTRNSLIMITSLLILTVIERKLIYCKMESPKWVATATGFAMNNRVVQLVFMFDGSLKEVAERLGDEDGRNIVENAQTTSNTNTDWLVIAKLIDRFALIAYLIVYCVMCIAFIP